MSRRLSPYTPPFVPSAGSAPDDDFSLMTPQDHDELAAVDAVNEQLAELAALEIMEEQAPRNGHGSRRRQELVQFILLAGVVTGTLAEGVLPASTVCVEEVLEHNRSLHIWAVCVLICRIVVFNLVHARLIP